MKHFDIKRSLKHPSIYTRADPKQNGQMAEDFFIWRISVEQDHPHMSRYFSPFWSPFHEDRRISCGPCGVSANKSIRRLRALPF
jgi:hypothetical protein